MGARKYWELFEKAEPKDDGGCPNCGSQTYFEGSHGGLSVNLECACCYMRWNANGFGFPWQFIGMGTGKGWQAGD